MSGRSHRLQDWEDHVEEVRELTSLPDLIAEHTKVSGDFALCPFHQDHDPSLHIFANGQRWKCFGCGEEGDSFTFIMKIQRIGFREAVEFLGKRVGKQWTRQGAEDDPEFQEYLDSVVERRRVSAILTESAQWMCNRCPSKVKDLIREQYGFDEQTRIDHLIGWAEPDGLLYWLKEECSYTDAQLVQSGLFVRIGERLEGFFDQRIVFPYLRGSQVVYAIGRRTRFTSDEPYEKGKYKKLLTHSEKHPEVSETIGNDWFYAEDDTRGTVTLLVITEGVTDCITLRMLGYKSTSPVTVRFRRKDLPKLIELTKGIARIIICNDSDVLADGTSPGLEGALQTAEALFRAGRNVLIAELPRPEGASKIDVNEFACAAMKEAEELGHEDPKAYARKKLDAVFAEARPYPLFLIESVPTEINPTALSERLKPILEVVASCPPLERDGYAARIARRFKIKKSTVAASVAELVPEQERRDQEHEEPKAEAFDLEDERVRGLVFEDVSHYYVHGYKVDEIISSFTLRPKQIVKHEHGAIVDCDVRAKGVAKDFHHPFSLAAFRSKRDFIREFQHPSMIWTGNDDNVMNLLALLHTAELPVQVGTTTLGYHVTESGPRWVTPAAIFGPDGPVDDSEIVYVESRSALAQRLRYEFVESEEIERLIGFTFPRLLRVNEPRVMLPIIGWFFATVLKPKIMDALSHFPLLLLHGSQGSGKTSLIRDVFWPLFGVYYQRDPFSCTDTPFSMISNLASTNALPIMLDEYRPSDMGRHKTEAIHRIARRIYNCEVEMRGKSDQSVVRYRLQAPVCLAGETRPDGDPALLERLISVNPDKTALTAERTRIFNELSTAELYKLAAPIVQFALRQDFEALIKKADGMTRNLLDRIDRAVPIRCFDNLKVMVLGLWLFEQMAREYHVDLPDVDYVEAFSATVSELLEGDGQNVKDACDSMVESLSVLAHLGLLIEERHFGLREGKVLLYLAACYKVYLDERKRAGLPDETNGLRALRKIMREKMQMGSYIKSVDKRARIGESMVRCVEIDQDQIPESLDYERFPANADKKSRQGGWDWTSDRESDEEKYETN